MIERLVLYPPLAIARLGASDTPLDCFHWGPNDLRPRGTGQTTVRSAETIDVDANGNTAVRIPSEIAFRDQAGIRPVCPFFELHAVWRKDSDSPAHEDLVTPELLARFQLRLQDLQWTVSVANLKAFHYTGNRGDRIETNLTLIGDDTSVHELRASSPTDSARPLARSGRLPILGKVQLTRHSDALPGLRLRFSAPRGLVYGPENLGARTTTFVLPDDQLVLNPEAAWCAWNLNEAADVRTNPGGLLTTDVNGVSLGLLDDVSDGIISVSLPGVPTAKARVAVGPPHYAPDRRPIVSLADGLTDRVQRDDVEAASYYDTRERFELTSQEVRDLLERVFETVHLLNVDYQNRRALAENRAIARGQGLPASAADKINFPAVAAIGGHPLPLVERARQRHRRFLSQEAFEDMLRERPALLDTVIRTPMTGERYYDRRMPALMRGSDRLPWHLTRRQYAMLGRWAERLRRDNEDNS